VRRAPWLALLGLLLTLPASAEVRRLEVVGAVPAGADAQPGVPIAEAALGAALAQGVERVARDLLSDEVAADPGLDLDKVLGGNPRDFAVSYQVLEDRGERRALLLVDPEVETEYELLVEVFVDVSRVESALRAAGLGLKAAEGPGREHHLVVEKLPSYRAYLALRRHLMERVGATSVTPAIFESGRAELRVEAAVEPSQLMERLVATPPEGLRVEPLFADGRSIWIRVAEVPGALED
jgi:hypothetical protein